MRLSSNCSERLTEAIRLWKIADVLKVPFHQMVRRMESWMDEQTKGR